MIPGWLDAIEAEVTACLGPHGRLSTGDLASALRVSESCALGYIVLLVGAGRLNIDAVSLPDHSHAGGDLPVARAG
jgi:hypothetical protein